MPAVKHAAGAQSILWQGSRAGYVCVYGRAPGHCVKVMLALAAPTLGQKPPDWHESHSVAPVVELNVPAPHGSHAALPALAANCPGEHRTQTAPVLSAYSPGEQATQRGVLHVLGSDSMWLRELL